MRIVGAIAQSLGQEMDRGRGGNLVSPFPVSLEPQFTPFSHGEIHQRTGLRAEVSETPRAAPIPVSDLKFLRARLSPIDTFSPSLSEQLLLALGLRNPIAFEVVGRGGIVSIQFTAAKQDTPNLASQLRSHYPRAQFFESSDLVQQEGMPDLLARSYRLRDSHLFQIRVEQKLESYLALIGILGGLGAGEAGLFQVLFQPVRHPWHENILKVACDPWDSSKSAFIDLHDLPRKARNKIERPLLVVAVRLAATTQDLLQRLEGSFLSQFESGENGLIQIAPSYPQKALQGRFTQTPGMLLNVRELAALVHLPDPTAVAEGLETAQFSTAAPKLATQDILAPLGCNSYRGAETPVGISEEQLTRHVAILGGTGSGKTNLMKVAFSPLLDQGYGMAVLDPKGDLAQGLLDVVPEHRLEDVVWFDPTDRAFPPALNVLNSSADLPNEDLTAELMLGLKRLFRGSAEFGPRMEWILRTAVRTLLDSQGEKTLCDIPRFLEDASYRSTVLGSVQDRPLRDFWQSRNLSRNVIDPVLNRLSSFLDRPSIRDVVCQPNRIDFRQIMRDKKIFIANLEKGKLQDGAFVLGSFILSRLQLAALSRPADERSLFPVLVDEFHVYAGQGTDTESIETFLSETRSYRAPLVVSTQYLGRLNRSVVAALFGNLGTQVCMHMGQIDAVVLQRELGRFSAEDLMNLGIGQAIIRMGSAMDTFNVSVPLAEVRVSNRTAIIERSRERYCRPRSEVAKLLRHQSEPETPAHRPGSGDGEDRVFVPGELWRRQSAAGHPQEERPAVPIPQRVDNKDKERAQDTIRSGTPVHKELVVYLEHIAGHPFLPALKRDEVLQLSRYKGSTIRRSLLDSSYISLHKVGTGTRSGQIVLQEITATGYELLASMKIRVLKPRGRGGFLHKYYCYQLKEFAEATWPGSLVEIEDGSLGKFADVTVKMPPSSMEQQQRVLAFEVYMTGEAKEIRGIAKGVEVFDRVVVCADSRPALESLKRTAVETLGSGILEKVSFHLVSQYLTSGTSDSLEAQPVGPSLDSRTVSPPKSSASIHEEPRSRKQDLLKNPAKSETEVESQTTSGKKRGRRPKTPLMEQVEQAYVHLHDLDWLQECDLARLPEVRQKTQPHQTMPEAQALRDLLIAAARQVIGDMGQVPGKEGLATFLQGYLAGRSVAEIAQELGVSREWCSRNYRREGLRLAGTQFVRTISRGL